jgi:hypothetical protein
VAMEAHGNHVTASLERFTPPPSYTTLPEQCSSHLQLSSANLRRYPGKHQLLRLRRTARG